VGRQKVTVMVCEMCGSQTIDDGFPLGLTLHSAVYHAGGGGGGLPKGSFICMKCIEGGVSVRDFVHEAMFKED
jgi:hypothetical protein